jgi:hypothetical protein
MLDIDDQTKALIEAVGPLVCEVNLPEAWEPGRKGPLPKRLDERRRYPRFHYCVCAALQHGSTFPSLHRAPAWHKVFTKDLSRGGIAFYHGEQLFPRERMPLVLCGHGTGTIEVVRCLRVQEDCYLVGARLVERFRMFASPNGKRPGRPRT